MAEDKIRVDDFAILKVYPLYYHNESPVFKDIVF